ncbi:hypothetical protein [Ornithinimicrobium murale]|uniref:hypothetical protein n=1 Tax=Ornithinimicrobium murale TaxID=1050153 RepID=UPI000E0DFAD7|nr:hypothetical protein [Ornithinimicrobium murale]
MLVQPPQHQSGAGWLPLVSALAGFIVRARLISGWERDRGDAIFHTVADEEASAAWLGKRFKSGRGPKQWGLARNDLINNS